MSAIDDWKRKQSTPAQPGAPMGGAQTPRLDAMKAKGSLRDEIDNRMAKPDPKKVDEQMKALKEAVPAWVKDGLGLKGREARQVEKVAKEFAKKEGRLPTVTEIEQSIPDFIELPKQVPSDDAAASYHPFKVSSKTENGFTTFGVDYWSGLYKSLKPNDKQTITGLLDEEYQNGWFSANAGDKIWLQVEFDTSGTVTAAKIEHGTSFDVTLDGWETNAYVEDDGEDTPAHKYSRKLIAYITAEGTAKKVNQVMFHDQILRNVCIDGRPARYPFDHEGGYPL